MAKRPYEPDEFDLLGSGPIPAGTLEKDLARWEWWQNRGIPGESMADRLDAEAKIAKMGWSCTYGWGTDRHGKPYVGRVLQPSPPAHPQQSPERRPADDAWEASNVALREQQAAELPVFMAEHAPAKTPDAGSGNFTLKKVYGAPEPDPSNIPKYEDSAHSKESRRQANARRASDPSAQAERKITRS